MRPKYLLPRVGNQKMPKTWKAGQLIVTAEHIKLQSALYTCCALDCIYACVGGALCKTCRAVALLSHDEDKAITNELMGGPQ